MRDQKRFERCPGCRSWLSRQGLLDWCPVCGATLGTPGYYVEVVENGTARWERLPTGTDERTLARDHDG
jgi:hypothetical protein